jgi:hypothetical protein
MPYIISIEVSLLISREVSVEVYYAYTGLSIVGGIDAH